ncbi:hypothetical protein QTP70_001424, partial [Hemibagrus guttatus]
SVRCGDPEQGAAESNFFYTQIIKSNSRTTSTGAPQGCVLSPLLFSLYTNDCTSTDPSIKLLKFADDTTVIGLIQDGDESAYRQEIEQLAAWCSRNNLELNTLKTVEMIVDFRRNTPALPPLTIMNSTVPTVASFRFLGTTISQDLKWDTHIDATIKKAQQRLYFLRQLRKFNLPQELLIHFYSAVIESVLCTSITVWFGSATKSDMRRLQRTVRTAERIIGAPLPTLQELYTSRFRLALFEAKGISDQAEQDLKCRCRDYMLELSKEIRKRLPDNIKQLEALKFLSPIHVLSSKQQQIWIEEHQKVRRREKKAQLGGNPPNLATLPSGYRAEPHPNLGYSDHISVMLIPAYRPLVRRSKPVLKQFKTWPSGAIAALQDCFECTDWNMFKEAATNGDSINLEEYTTSVTNYIGKCIDNVIVSKTITTCSNQKPWMTAEVRALLKSRDSAFRAGDKVA